MSGEGGLCATCGQPTGSGLCEWSLKEFAKLDTSMQVDSGAGSHVRSHAISPMKDHRIPIDDFRPPELLTSEIQGRLCARRCSRQCNVCVTGRV